MTGVPPAGPEEARANGLLVRVLTPIVAPFVIAWDLVRLGVPATGRAVMALIRSLGVRLRAAATDTLVVLREERRVLVHLRNRGTIVLRGVSGAAADLLRAAGRAIGAGIRTVVGVARPLVLRAVMAVRTAAAEVAEAIRALTRPVVTVLRHWASLVRQLGSRAWAALRGVAGTIAASVRAVGRAIASATRVCAAAARELAGRARVAIRGLAEGLAAVVRRVGAAARGLAAGAWRILSAPLLRLIAGIAVIGRTIARLVGLVANRVAHAIRAVAAAVSDGLRTVAAWLAAIGRAVRDATRAVAAHLAGALRAIAAILGLVASRIERGIGRVALAVADVIGRGWRSLAHVVTSVAVVVATTLAMVAGRVGRLVRAATHAVADAVGRVWRRAVSVVDRLGRRLGAFVAAVGGLAHRAIDRVAAVIIPIGAWMADRLSEAVHAVVAVARRLAIRLRTAVRLVRFSGRVAWHTARRALVVLGTAVVGAITVAGRTVRTGLFRLARLLAPVVVVPARVLIAVARRAATAGRHTWRRVAAAAGRMRAAIRSTIASTRRGLSASAARIRASVTATVRDVRRSLGDLRRSVARSLGRTPGEPHDEGPSVATSSLSIPRRRVAPTRPTSIAPVVHVAPGPVVRQCPEPAAPAEPLATVEPPTVPTSSASTDLPMRVASRPRPSIRWSRGAAAREAALLLRTGSRASSVVPTSPAPASPPEGPADPPRPRASRRRRHPR